MTGLFHGDRHALILMDLQNDVIHAEGALGRRGTAALIAGPGGTAERAAELMAAYRASGGLIIHVAVAFRPGYPDADPAVPLSKAGIDLGCLIEGSWGAAFAEPFTPLGGEPVVVKRGMSGFAGTDLDLLLRIARVQTLVLAGVATNLVVEGTARQAVDLGYRVVVPADSSMGFSRAHHESSLDVLKHFTTVVTVADVLSELGDEQVAARNP